MILPTGLKKVEIGPKWQIAYKFTSLPNKNIMCLIFKKCCKEV